VTAVVRQLRSRERGPPMSGSKGDEVKGRVKEAAGDLTNDKDLKNEGKMDRATSDVKEKLDDAKDWVADKVDDVKDKARRD
jgi:uncharacterized protein YjbJ (UPF0337 family)